MSCNCLTNDREEATQRINSLAEDLSIDIITIILEDNLCPYAAEIMAGRMIAAISARIYLMSIGPEEASKIETVRILDVPGTRLSLETIFGHARAVTEENSIARA